MDSTIFTQHIRTDYPAYQPYPAAVFTALCVQRPPTPLLESAEVASIANLKSILILHSPLRNRRTGHSVTAEPLPSNVAALLPVLP
ncbi:anthranilate synthase component I, partial [Morganella morganii]|nr:anthranilate synthase component I [Morganella morganii]